MDKWENTALTLPTPESPNLRQLIESNSTQVCVEGKHPVHIPGDVIDGVYYVLKGRMRHYMLADDGTEKTLYSLTEGWFFGETPCILKEPTGLHTDAETDMTLALIPTEKFNDLINRNQEFRTAILESLCRKLHILRYQVEDLFFLSCKERLKRLLCSVVDTSSLEDAKWYRLKVYYTQSQVGAIVGSARVTIAKLMTELCDEGFIRVLNRNIQVSMEGYQRMLEETDDTI